MDNSLCVFLFLEMGKNLLFACCGEFAEKFFSVFRKASVPVGIIRKNGNELLLVQLQHHVYKHGVRHHDIVLYLSDGN